MSLELTLFCDKSGYQKDLDYYLPFLSFVVSPHMYHQRTADVQELPPFPT